MVIDWSIFAPALVMLLIPIGIFHGKNTRYRAISRNWVEQGSRVLAMPHHVIDFVRAGLGAWMLQHSLTAAAGADGLMQHLPTMIQAAVLMLGVFLQTIVCKENDALNAPFAYVTGTVIGFLPPVVAGFALLFSVVITMGTRSASAYFVVLPVSIAAAGVLFTGTEFILGIAALCLAVLMPWLIALLFAQELVLTYRRRMHSQTHPPVREPEPR